ncbi:MAG: cupin domain-containing protein [Pirellulales bacterium]
MPADSFHRDPATESTSCLELLLGQVPRRQFIDEYFLKQPFASAGGASQFTALGNWDTVERLLAHADADVLVVREGRRVELAEPPSYDQARRLHDQGYTVLVRHAERHDVRLADLAGGLRRDFLGPVDVHLYCTPARQHGFGWHYDAEEVFVLQTVGSKEYCLRKNTVHPWPLVETLPADMRYEREIMPLSRCLLEAGDWLYIPAGYWHRALAQQASISLAIGVLPPTAIDAYDFLRRHLLESLRWRQRLPVAGQNGPMGDEQLLALYRTVFADLAADLGRTLLDDGWLRAFVASRSGEPGEPAIQPFGKQGGP